MHLHILEQQQLLDIKKQCQTTRNKTHFQGERKYLRKNSKYLFIIYEKIAEIFTINIYDKNRYFHINGYVSD